jgi:alkylated DNA repair dioxygenase AlkB
MDLFDTSAGQPKLCVDMPTEAGYAVLPDTEWSGHHIRVPNGGLFYAERFFDTKISDRTVEYFQQNNTMEWQEANWRGLSPDALKDIEFTNINWKQDTISFYGKNIPLPRITSWYGDTGKSYTYSGITSRPNPWNKGLLYIKSQIESCAKTSFNSVLLNWYRDGEDHLSWHSDDEKELGINPIIASANFGETRDFVLRRKDDHSRKITFPLKHGTLLIMKGDLQHFWEHAVPKRKNVKGSRFNLTFRRIGL